jgi:hypothetical protein
MIAVRPLQLLNLCPDRPAAGSRLRCWYWIQFWLVAGESRRPATWLNPDKWVHPAIMNEHSFIYRGIKSMSSLKYRLIKKEKKFGVSMKRSVIYKFSIRFRGSMWLRSTFRSA